MFKSYLDSCVWAPNKVRWEEDLLTDYRAHRVGHSSSLSKQRSTQRGVSHGHRAQKAQNPEAEKDTKVIKLPSGESAIYN